MRILRHVITLSDSKRTGINVPKKNPGAVLINSPADPTAGPYSFLKHFLMDIQIKNAIGSQVSEPVTNKNKVESFY